MEGAIFVTGAAIQWMRDGLGIIGDAAETGPLAASVPDTGGISVVPAFTGLGSPWWDPFARGTIVGITRGTTRAHVARAIVEAMAFQTADVVDAVTHAAGTPLTEMRVDGGASVMDLLCQFQADVLGVPVRRAAIQETTALGAAYLAGVAEGVWASPEEVNARWSADASFIPAMDGDERAPRLAQWRRAVERSRDWRACAPLRAKRSALRRRGSRCADVGERGDVRDLARNVLGLLGRIGVDVLVARQLADLVHHLVGELPQREAVVLHAGVAAGSTGWPKRIVTRRNSFGSFESTGCTSSVPIMPIGTMVALQRIARRATPVCPRCSLPSRVRVPSG